MYIKRLDIQGFKSFAHKNTLGFTKGTTAIVGPNGSGKSNVADAIRWVLGETSLKILRGKRVQDVIFSGSSKKARLGLAEVSLYIDNEDGRIPVEYPEVVITRRVYQSGEGEYVLNKKKVRLADILLLLARANIGQKSYAVIGQGMIDSVLASTPADRKNFFDEAVGVRQYQMKREKAYNKLSRTYDNLQQAGALIAEIEPRLRSLTRQVRRLERREETEAGLKKIQLAHYSRRWHLIADEITEQRKKQQELSTVQKQFDGEVQSLTEKIESQAQEDSRVELFRQLQKEYDDIASEKNELLQREAVLKGRAEIGKVKSGRSDLVFWEKRKVSLNKRLDVLGEDLRAVQAAGQREEKFLAEKSAAQQEIVIEFQEREKKLKIAKTRFEKAGVGDIGRLRREMSEVEEFAEQFIQRMEKVDTPDQLASLQKEAHKFLDHIKSLKKELEDVLCEQDPKEVIDLQDSLTEFIKGRDNLVNEIHEIRTRLSTVKEKEKLVSEEISRTGKELTDIVGELNLANGGTEELSQEQGAVKDQLQAVEQRLEEVKAKLSGFNLKEQEKKDHLFQLQKAIREKQAAATKQTMLLNEVNVGLAKLETKQEDLEKEAAEEIGQENLKKIQGLEPLPESAASPEQEKQEIQRLKHQLELIGGIDPAVEGEYKETNERYQFLTTQTRDLDEAIKSLEKVIAELDDKIKKQFNASFEKINQEFGKYFRILFAGGKAGLILQKEKEVLAEAEEDKENSESEEDEPGQERPEILKKQENVISGIEIYATPPGKKLKSLSMLSGGERALASIALISAIIASNPPPFVVLDEVDAALDESNSIRFAKIVRELSRTTQFITITHNRATMHQANILYGITMGDDGVSKLLSIKMEEAERIRNERVVKEKEKA